PISRGRRLLQSVTVTRSLIAGLALLAIAIGSFMWATRTVVRVPVAVAPLANHTGEPELDGYRLALTEALVDDLSDSPNIRVLPYPQLLEIVRKFISAGDVSSSEAIGAIGMRSGARFVIVPTLEYAAGSASWHAHVEIRSTDTGAAAGAYDTDAITSS